MNFLRTTPAEQSTAADLRNVVIVGDEFPWLPANARLADRAVVRCANRDEVLRALDTGTVDGVIACLPETGKNLAILRAAIGAQPTLACGVRAEGTQTAKLALDYPRIPVVQNLETLDDLVRTMFATSRWNADPAFEALKARITRFPALPELYQQITAALQREDASVEEIAGLISREPTITAKILQVVNSPVFALRQRVTSVRDAASFLGLQRIRALVMSTSLMGQCDVSRCQAFNPETFEHHSVKTANWASRIMVGETRDRQLGELAFTAGLLHQFGMLLLAANLPESYDSVLRLAGEQKVSIARIERQNYGVTHAELAGFVFAGWHIPFQIVNAIGFYALPSLSTETNLSPLTAVHLASAINAYTHTGVSEHDRTYLEQAGLAARVDDWVRKLTVDED